MTFHSVHFLIFLPVVLILYYTAAHKYRWMILLAASYYAYMSWNPGLAILILGTTLVSYTAGMLISKTQTPWVKRLLLAITLSVCLGALVFFKYFTFLLDNILGVLSFFSLNLQAPAFDIILPVGISFYTFQTLSYVIDVYRGIMPPEQHFGYYALFVSYFPQLVAGPIERPQDLIPQLRTEHHFQWENIASGFRLMAAGFFRKCVVADYLGGFVDRVYGNVSNANALSIAIAALLFMGQIYNDFAGYSEIAMGAAKMMGINLTRNFDKPLSARSIREYMRRWHITLNTWFRDYVYIPLGGSRRGPVRRMINIFIVYTLCGLWHGANWTYVLWGMTTGVVVIFESLTARPLNALLKKLRISPDSTGFQLLGHLWVLLICGIVAIIFRATSIAHIEELFTRFFTSLGFGPEYIAQAMQSLSIGSMDVLKIGLICASLVAIRDMADYVPQNKSFSASEQSRHLARISAYCYLILAILLSWIAAYGTGSSSAFVYFQF